MGLEPREYGFEPRELARTEANAPPLHLPAGTSSRSSTSGAHCSEFRTLHHDVFVMTSGGERDDANARR